MVCFTGDPIYNNVLYEENYDDMPALEHPEEYPEEDEVIINPAEEDYNEEENVGQRRRRRDDDERQPNDYEEYLEEMLEYYNDSIQRQSVFFPTTFDLPPELSRGGEPNGRPRQRQQQLLSEILYEHLRVMFSHNNNDNNS